MKHKSGELNYVFWVVCILSVIRNLTHIAKSFMNLLTPETIDFMGKQLSISSHPASLYSILSSLFVIIALILTLNKRKIGVWGFFAVQFVSAFVSLAFSEEPLKQMPVSFGLALFHSVAFSCLLLIRRNGISSWKVIFNNNLAGNDNINEPDNSAIKINDNTDKIISEHYKERVAPELSISQDNELENDKQSELDEVPIQKNEITGCQISHDEEHPESTKADIYNRKTYNLARYLKVMLIIVVSLALLSGITYGLWSVYNNSRPENQYEKANKLFGKGNIKEAINIYTKLADEDDYIPAKTKLGILYVKNDSVTPNYKLGIKYLVENASIDSIALAVLMDIYQPGSDLCEGKYANKEKIEYYSKMALRQKHYVARAYFFLGNLEAERKNYELAFYYWDKSSHYNFPNACDNLGWMYFNGNGVEENNTKAKYYFEKALRMESNDDYALYYLGLIYENGYGVAKDMQKAVKLLKKSAELGNDNAKAEVARIQMNKKSVGLWINGEEL